MQIDTEIPYKLIVKLYIFSKHKTFLDENKYQINFLVYVKVTVLIHSVEICIHKDTKFENNIQFSDGLKVSVQNAFSKGYSMNHFWF